MKKITVAGCAVLCVSVLWMCRTAPEPQRTTPDASAQAAVAQMKTYIADAGRKMDEMAVSEAVSLYVAALALKDGLVPAPREAIAREAADLAGAAESALTKIEAGFLLQAGAEWLNADAVQIAASSAGNLTAPKVTLWYNVGGSRIAVSAAPVVFTVKLGQARIAGTGAVKTNEYGEASIPPPAILDAGREVVVSAAIVFSAGGFRYPFRQTKLDLVYRPPQRRAVILVLERDDQGAVNDNPEVLDPVFGALKGKEFDFSQYNGRLLGDDFMKVYGGDLEAIKGLTLERNVPYLVLVLNDCYNVQRQRAFNIYISEARAVLRVVRVADGKILFEAIGYADRKHDTYGQHNSHDNAARDAFKRAAAELVAELSRKDKELGDALGVH